MYQSLSDWIELLDLFGDGREAWVVVEDVLPLPRLDVGPDGVSTLMREPTRCDWRCSYGGARRMMSKPFASRSMGPRTSRRCHSIRPAFPDRIAWS
jgi:hypothetical protein